MSAPIEVTATAVLAAALAVAAVISSPAPRFKPELPETPKQEQAEQPESPKHVVEPALEITPNTEAQRLANIEQAVSVEKAGQIKLTQQVKALTEEIRKK